jgi:hypothetical protein
MNARNAVAFVVMSLVVATRLPAQTEGIKEADRFIKSIDGSSQSVTDARLKIKGALDSYNALVKGDSTDMKGDYKKLVNAEKDMNSQVANTRKIANDMDKQGAVYFAARSEAINQIQDPSLRDQAKSRLDESKQAFEKVKTSLRGAGNSLTPFAKDLSDHIKYLGAELTPAAVASLKPQAEQLNKQGEKLFAQTDSALTAATNYLNTLKAG